MNSRKHFFNMVEVALALLVISLGLSTVLTLFPAGLKATREAENANNVVEAAEYIFAYLQTRVNESGLNEIKIASKDNSTYGVSSNGERIEEKGDGTYIYHKAVSNAEEAGYIEEFSCVIRVLDALKGMGSGDTSKDYILSVPVLPNQTGNISFKDSNDVEYKFQQATQGGSVKQTKISDIIKVVDVELSYPTSAKYDNREKRVFRMVFLSNTYVPHPQNNN